MDARQRLIALLREHALVLGEITLTSGARASYYVDAKRATLLPEGFAALGELVAGSSATAAPAAITHRHSQPRRFIDDAAKTLSSPFAAAVKSSNQWVDHGLPAVFALLAYGVGLGYLARFASVH